MKIRSASLAIFLCLIPATAFSEGPNPPTGATSLPPPAFEVDPTRSDPGRPARARMRPYPGPIIDTQVHLNTRRGHDPEPGALEDVVTVIRDTGVELAIFMATPNEGRKPNSDARIDHRKMLHDLARDRIKLFCCGTYITYWLHLAHRNGYSKEDLDGILKRLAKDLDSNDTAGIGEIGLYHFNKNGEQSVISYPPDFEPFLRIADVVARKGKWFDLHAEPVDPEGKSYEAKVFGGIEYLFRRNPDLKLILSHTAMTNPANLRKLLRRYPNVMINVKHRKSHWNWRNLEPINNLKLELYEDWARLFEELPERFMIGTDEKFWRRGRAPSKYRNKIKQTRRILGALNPRAARLIAYENARKIFASD